MTENIEQLMKRQNDANTKIAILEAKKADKEKEAKELEDKLIADGFDLSDLDSSIKLYEEKIKNAVLVLESEVENAEKQLEELGN